MENVTRIFHHRLIEWTLKLLETAGFDHAQTSRFTEALIWSDLVGRTTHGVWRLPTYLARLEAKVIKCPCSPSFSHDSHAVAIMDGDQGLGHYVGHEAMRCAIGKAEKFGIGAVAVHNSNHFGIGAYFVNLAAERDMIGLAFSNSTAKVVAHGGIKPVFGTNPIAFGAPGRDGSHLLLDMSTSAVCGTQVQRFAEEGLPLPQGIAIDLGQMTSLAVFTERLEILSNSVRNSGLDDGDVHIPGDTRWARHKENMLLGIPIEASTLSALDNLAIRYGIPTIKHSANASAAKARTKQPE